MRYVVTRPYPLPVTKADMEDEYWFSLWQLRRWPYTDPDVAEGAEIFWVATGEADKPITWRTSITQIEKFQYGTVDDALAHLATTFGGDADRYQPNLVDKPDSGYCVAWRVRVLPAQVPAPKPDSIRIDQLGWMRVDGDRSLEAWVRATAR